VCDVCGSTEFIRRADDNEKTVRDRLGIYNKQTTPLVAYYAARRNLTQVDGMAAIADVNRQIEEVLNGA
jgi:adenylate kinase